MAATVGVGKVNRNAERIVDFLAASEFLTTIYCNLFRIFPEQKGIKVLKKYLAKENGLIISHRLHIIKEMSEEIILLDKAKILTQGTHESLLEENEFYRNLWTEYQATKDLA